MNKFEKFVDDLEKMAANKHEEAAKLRNKAKELEELDAILCFKNMAIEFLNKAETIDNVKRLFMLRFSDEIAKED